MTFADFELSSSKKRQRVSLDSIKQFKARKVPDFSIPTTVPLLAEKKMTTFKEFNLRTEQLKPKTSILQENEEI